MGNKRGRNDPCWCGSGLKFKKCHLNRHREEPSPTWETEADFRKSFSSKYCSCPEEFKGNCKGSIINAHTVSKSSSLKTIAREGHVYGVVLSFKKLAKTNGIFIPELVGINKASTFTGFCSAHDSQIFSEIENNKFTSTKKQLFLHGYRSLAREYFTKMGQVGVQGSIRSSDRGKDLNEQQQIQKIAFLSSIALQAGVRDVSYHKANFDATLVADEYDSVKGYVVKFGGVLPVVCSGAIYPSRDFEGRVLQDISELESTPDNLCFSLFSSDRETYAVFMWLSDSEKTCRKLLKSFEQIDDDDVFSNLLRFVFVSFENVFMSPEWWESKTESERNIVVKWISTGADPRLPSRSSMKFGKCYEFDRFDVLSRGYVG